MTGEESSLKLQCHELQLRGSHGNATRQDINRPRFKRIWHDALVKQPYRWMQRNMLASAHGTAFFRISVNVFNNAVRSRGPLRSLTDTPKMTGYIENKIIHKSPALQQENEQVGYF